MASRKRVARPRGGFKDQKLVPAVQTGDGAKNGDPSSEQDDEARQAAFEKELDWCITQIQVGLRTGKPDKSQVCEAEKILKVLENPKALLVRKRQMMRQNFGDYRKKMLEEEKKHSHSNTTRPQPNIHSGDAPLKESQFFRQSVKKASSTAGAWVERNLQSGHSGKIPYNLPQEMESENVGKTSIVCEHKGLDKTEDQMETNYKNIEILMDNGQMVSSDQAIQILETSQTLPDMCANKRTISETFESVTIPCTELDQTVPTISENQFKFQKSDNCFRFNFT